MNPNLETLQSKTTAKIFEKLKNGIPVNANDQNDLSSGFAVVISEVIKKIDADDITFKTDESEQAIIGMLAWSMMIMLLGDDNPTDHIEMV
jgi:hypothetical protein